MNRLGDLERSVMDQLWQNPGTRSVREVHAALSGDRDLAYTTVMTVLDRLAKKGLVVRERDGRAYRYAPAQTREDLVAEVMHTALADDPAERTAALVAFVGRVSAEDADAMRAALAQLEDEQTKATQPKSAQPKSAQPKSAQPKSAQRPRATTRP